MKTDLLKVVQHAVQSEIDALTYVKQFINEDIINCANEILKAKGRVIVTGIGKSASTSNEAVESVFMKYKYGNSLCVSSSVRQDRTSRGAR